MKHTGCLHFITLMNLLYLPTSVNCPQDIISHIQVVHRLQVKSMHSLIRVWFLNPFRLPSSQCEAYSQHLYKCQCCFVVDCILQILFSSYPISLSFNQSLVAKIKKHFNQSTMSLLFYVILFYRCRGQKSLQSSYFLMVDPVRNDCGDCFGNPKCVPDTGYSLQQA